MLRCTRCQKLLDRESRLRKTPEEEIELELKKGKASCKEKLEVEIAKACLESTEG